MSNYRPLRLGDTMPFGKYKGITIADLIEKDHGYFQWLKKNTDVRFSFTGTPKVLKQEKEVKLASLDTILKSGKYEGCTVAEIIRCNPEYVRINMKDKLDRRAEFFLNNAPENALKALLKTQGGFIPLSDNQKLGNSRWLREGMSHMISLRTFDPVFIA